ncbi:DUF2520 domain-containing protein [Calidifontibacter sp. DB0510]|uniref:DUF2520 domain-containing protein n=1 Tax=Metallococcus carri TaxID=1656884 RepID=A0A967AZ50_9MICO|nr:DUF2520 domain-containing protein [Metallococcus carri]NHN55358.1 DUF2520 domain-containing protein [Metallococcus carri]NOP36435.1 DUF2520 domain-containing protein [Calidifontibacter sp. DB2511S]
MNNPPSLRVAIIGCGKVGSVLGAALAAAGHEVVAVSATSDASLERAATLLPGVPVLPIPQVARAGEVVLMTVPDDALGPLAAGLATEGAWDGGRLVVHASGFHGTAVLEPVLHAGGDVIAMHPAMTFAGTPKDLERISGTPFAVTASPGAELVGQALAIDIGGDPFLLAEEDRPKYHAALSHGSNHLVTLVAQAQQLLREVGIDDPSRLLSPLLQASLDNSLERGDKALTGPVSRGDVATVAAHLRVLAGSEDVEMAYRAMARATAMRTARRRAMPAESVQPLLEELS